MTGTILRVIAMASVLAELNSSALAAFITVQNIPASINGTNGNKADFGSGGHSGGAPAASGNVKWDYDNESASRVG